MQVHNKYHNTASFDAVYIGRGSPWGNPYSTKESVYPTLQVATTEEAITKFKEYVLSDADLLRKVRAELKGKDLVCFCKPKPCHGDVLLELANEETTC
jgi:hypothetical protein